MDILVEKVKYLIYDNNNEFLDYQTYLSNPSLASGVNYGSMHWSIQLENRIAYTSVADIIPPYSKSALILFRNGVNIAYSNGYKWCVYLEWDIPVPNNGFRHHIDDLIHKLENEKKDAIMFLHDYAKESTYLDFLWHGMFIVNSNIATVPILNEKWHVDTEAWLKTWGGSFYEYILQKIIKNFYNNNILTENIKLYSEKMWGTQNYINLQKSVVQHTTKKVKINKKNPECIHIFPKKENDDYELYLYIILNSENIQNSNAIEIKNLKVFYDNNCIVSHETYLGYANTFYCEKLPEYHKFEKIEITFEIDKGNGNEKYTEFFYTKDIKDIYENIFKIV